MSIAVPENAFPIVVASLIVFASTTMTKYVVDTASPVGNVPAVVRSTGQPVVRPCAVIPIVSDAGVTFADVNANAPYTGNPCEKNHAHSSFLSPDGVPV